MPTLTDSRFDALRAQGFTGATNDMILQWLHASGATSPAIPDAWAEVLIGLGYEAYQRNDAWYQYLGDQGYAGTLSDRELAFWIDGGVIGGGYVFNGSTQYATHAPWTVLGDPVAYPPQFSANTDNPDGNILDPTLPVSEFGRNGASYHSGSLSNLRYIDTSPVQDTDYYDASVAPLVLPTLDMTGATLTVDLIHMTGSYALVGGTEDFVTVTGDTVTTGPSVTAATIDGDPITGDLVDGQHYRLEITTDGGEVTTLSGCGISTLNIVKVS